MASARRIAPVSTTHRLRRRARAVAASLAGGVAGLAAGAACVAWPPEGGAGAAPRLPPSTAVVPQGGHRPQAHAIGGVAAVLAPAAEAGVLSPRPRAGEGRMP